jgi:ATP-dependent DNA helicase RecG
MEMKTIKVTAEQAAYILTRDEGHFLDFKSKEIQPAKLTKALSAFANTDGGELYIGISEGKDKQSKSWLGFQNQEMANGHLQALNESFPRKYRY